MQSEVIKSISLGLFFNALCMKTNGKTEKQLSTSWEKNTVSTKPVVMRLDR